jgi:hypothetical protein
MISKDLRPDKAGVGTELGRARRGIEIEASGAAGLAELSEGSRDQD